MLNYLFVSFFSTQLVLFFAHYIIRGWMHRKFKHLTYGTCYKITTSTISGLQAAIVTLLSFRTLLICQDLLYDHDPVIEKYIFYMSFYFTYDLVVMYKGFIRVYKEQKQYDDSSTAANIILFLKSETMMVIHHAVLQFIGLPILMVYRRGLGTFFIGGFFAAEVSTPFYSVRNILKNVGVTKGLLYEINGALFIGTFLCGRLLMIPFMYYRYSIYKNLSFFHVPLNIPWHCNASCFLFLSLQIYWFRLILKNFLKYLSKVKSKVS